MIHGDRDGPSPEVDADTQSAITTLFLLEQQLNAARSLPGRDVVLQVMADGGGLLSCFVRVSSRDPTAAAELVLAYASWRAAFYLSCESATKTQKSPMWAFEGLWDEKRSDCEQKGEKNTKPLGF